MPSWHSVPPEYGVASGPRSKIFHTITLCDKKGIYLNLLMVLVITNHSGSYDLSDQKHYLHSHNMISILLEAIPTLVTGAMILNAEGYC